MIFRSDDSARDEAHWVDLGAAGDLDRDFQFPDPPDAYEYSLPIPAPAAPTRGDA